MKAFITCLLLIALLGIVFVISFAQQNQTVQKPNQDIETPEERISVLENKPQTVENTEKMELEAKLADANAKLADAQTKLLNTEIDKYTGKLKDANDEWLRTWSLWFIGIISFFVVILFGVSGVFWFWLRSRADQLIADSVEKSLNGFKEAVEQVNILKNQLEEWEKSRAASVLSNLPYFSFADRRERPERIKTFSDELLLQIFSDETYYFETRVKAVEALANRKSKIFVSPVLEYLNSIVDSEFGAEFDSEPTSTIEHYLGRLVRLVGETNTNEAYQELKKLLNRLLTENPKHKNVILMSTVLECAYISVELNMRDSVPIIKKSMSHFEHPSDAELKSLCWYYDKFDEHLGIKEILIEHVTSEMPEVETKCLELLQKHDPDFVKEWQAQKANANAQNEESK